MRQLECHPLPKVTHLPLDQTALLDHPFPLSHLSHNLILRKLIEKEALSFSLHLLQAPLLPLPPSLPLSLHRHFHRSLPFNLSITIRIPLLNLIDGLRLIPPHRASPDGLSTQVQVLIINLFPPHPLLPGPTLLPHLMQCTCLPLMKSSSLSSPRLLPLTLPHPTLFLLVLRTLIYLTWNL